MAEFYADSSFLVSLYRRDSNQSQAQRSMATRPCLLAFSQLHRVEVRNALRNARSFGEISDEDCRNALRRIQLDLDEGALEHCGVEWTNVFRRADELSDSYATKHGQRTIDLLHVAIALEIGARTFLSFDRRRRRLAHAAGLKVRP